MLPPPESNSSPNPSPRNDAGLEIEVEGLHKSFGDHVVLSGVDLTILRGDLVAIVGGSGSGKTVLLELITGMLVPDTGSIRVANHELPGSPLVDVGEANEEVMDQIRIHWSIVFQRNALFSGTVYENLSLWLREVKRVDEATAMEKARAALKAVSLDPEQVLDDQREELSGGMAKRVAIARALAMDPMLIFYDEPTSGLDPMHAVRIHDLVAATHAEATPSGEKRTTVIITHDKDLLHRLKPRVVMLHGGEVFFDGPYTEFAAAESEVIRPYFDAMPAIQERRRN
jgi:phospholipid/cholesterol/gamma-HCH transport system ATP-binding protein